MHLVAFEGECSRRDVDDLPDLKAERISILVRQNFSCGIHVPKITDYSAFDIITIVLLESSAYDLTLIIPII